MPHLFAFRIISAPRMSHAILSKKKLVPPLDGMSDNDDKRDIYTDYSYWRIASSLVYYASRCSPLLTLIMLFVCNYQFATLANTAPRNILSSLGCAKKRPFVKSFSLIGRCPSQMIRKIVKSSFLSLSRDISIIARFISRARSLTFRPFDQISRAFLVFHEKRNSNRSDRSIV